MDQPSNFSQPQQYSYPGQGQTPDNVFSTNSQSGPAQTFHGGQVVQRTDTSWNQTSAQGIVDQTTQHVLDTYPVGYYPPQDQGNVQVPMHVQTRYHQQPFYTGHMRYTDTGHAFARQSHHQVYRGTAGSSHHQQQWQTYAGLNQTPAQHTMLASRPFTPRVQIQQNFLQPAFRPSARLNTGHGQSQPRLIWGQNPTVRPAIDTMERGLPQRYPHYPRIRFGHPDVGQHLTMMHNQRIQDPMQFQPQHSPRSRGQVNTGNVRLGHPLPQYPIHPASYVNQTGHCQNPTFQQQRNPPNQSEMLPEQSMHYTQIGPMRQGTRDFHQFESQLSMHPQPQPPLSQPHTTRNHSLQPLSDQYKPTDQAPNYRQAIPNRNLQTSQTIPKLHASWNPNAQELNSSARFSQEYTQGSPMTGSSYSSPRLSLCDQLNIQQGRHESPKTAEQGIAASLVGISPGANQQDALPVAQDPPAKIAKRDTVMHERIQPSESGLDSSSRSSRESPSGPSDISPATSRRYGCNQYTQGSSMPGTSHSSPWPSPSDQLNIQQARHRSPMTAYQGIAVSQETISTNTDRQVTQSAPQGPEAVAKRDGLSTPGSSCPSTQPCSSNHPDIQQGEHRSPVRSEQVITASRETITPDSNQRDGQPGTQSSPVKVLKRNVKRRRQNTPSITRNLSVKKQKAKRRGIKSRFDIGSVSTGEFVGHIGFQYNDSRRIEVSSSGASTPTQGQLDDFIKICNDFTASRTEDKVTSTFSQLSTPEKKVHPGFVISKYYTGDTAPEANAYIPDPLYVDHTKRVFKGKKIKIHQWLDDVNYAALVADAGAGKTTAAKRFCQMVLKHEIPSLGHIQLVQFVTFAELDSAKEHTGFDLIFKQPLGTKLTDDSVHHGYEWVKCHADEMLLVMDGLDQVGWSLEGINTSISYDQAASAPVIIHNILHKDLFTNCKVIITSREHAVWHFPADLRPSKTISLTGLSLEDCKYLISNLAGEMGDIILKHLLTKSPGLLSLCRTPVFSVFSVVVLLENVEDARKNLEDVLKNLKDAPKTMSGILIRVLALFVNSEHRRGKDMAAVFSKLKQLAYVGTSEKRVLFEVAEIEALGLGITEVQDLIIITPCANIPYLFKIMEGLYRLFYCHQSVQEALTALYICAMPLPDFQKLVDGNLDDPHFAVVRRIVLGVMLDSSLRGNLNDLVIGNPCDEEAKKKILRDWLQKILVKRQKKVRKDRTNLPWNMIKCSDIELCSLLNECGDGVSYIIAENMTSVDFTKRVLKADSLHAVAHVLSQSKHISMANFGKVEICDFENTELLTNCLVRCHHVKIRDLQLSNITKPLLDGSMNISRSFQEMQIKDGSQIMNPHERKLEVEVLTLLGVASDDVLGEALDLLSDSFQSIRVGKSSLRIQFQDSCEGSKKISICDMRDDKGKYQVITEEDLSTIQRVLKLFHQKFIAEMSDRQPVEGDAAFMRASELDHHQEVTVEFQAVKLSEPVLNPLINLFNKCKSVKIRNLQLSNITEPLLHGLMNISSSFQKMQIKDGPQKMNPHGRELEVEVLNLLGVAQAPDDILGEALDLLSNASQRIRFENSCLLIKFEDACEGNKKVSFQKEGTKKDTVEDLLLIQRAFQLSQLFECPQLKVLNLSWQNHGPGSCRHIGEIVKTARVEDLSLRQCNLTTEHVSELKEGLKGYVGQLKKLVVSRNKVICTKLGEIVEMFQVEELNIIMYGSESPTAQDVNNFLAALDSMRHKVRIKFINKRHEEVEGSTEELRENIKIRSG